MKTSLYAFFILSSLSIPKFALAEKKPCLKVKDNATVFKNSNKENAFIPKDTLLDPRKKNKKGTYYLVQYKSNLYWIKKEDVLLGRSSKCQVDGGIDSVTLTSAHSLSSNKKSPRFQMRIGYSVGGEATATDGFITNIANPDDVRKDQDPLITGNSFVSSLEVSASHLKNLGSGRLRSSLSYRMTKVNLEGFRNPDSDNGGLPVPLSSLSDPVTTEITFNALTLGAEYGFKLMTRGDFSLRAYIGAFFEYRLSDSDEISVLICGTESCPFKATEAQITSPIKQTAIAPSLAIEAEYKSLVFGLGLDTLYLPTFRVGISF